MVELLTREGLRLERVVLPPSLTAACAPPSNTIFFRASGNADADLAAVAREVGRFGATMALDARSAGAFAAVAAQLLAAR